MSYTGSLTLIPPASKRVYQRDVRSGNPPGNWAVTYGRGWGSVTVAVAPTVAVPLVEYRVRDAELLAGAPLLDWTPCATNLEPGPQILPVVVAGRAGWSVIDLRANGDDGSVVSTGAVGVGEVIAATGQSLASDFWSSIATGDPAKLATCGVLPTPYGTCLAAWDGSPIPASGAAWAAPSDGSPYSSTFCAEFLRLAVLGSGVNCGLVGYAWSGEPIASWKPDGSGPRNAWGPLTNLLDEAVGEGGKVGTFIWCHGHNDARISEAGTDGDELTTAQYLGALEPVFTALGVRYSGYPFRRILSSIPAIGSNWIATTPKFAASYIEQIRAAHLRHIQGDALALGHVDGLDSGLWSDQTHPSQAGNVTFARHFYRAFMRGLGSGLYVAGDSGPRLTGQGFRAAGAVEIHLPIVHVGGTTLNCIGGSAGAATQFQVFKSGSTSPADGLTIQGVDFSVANLIVLTLGVSVPDTQSVDVWYRLPPDADAALLPEHQIYDNNLMEIATDGLATGRQLAMFPAAITVPASAWHRPLLVGTGMPMLASAADPAFAL